MNKALAKQSKNKVMDGNATTAQTQSGANPSNSAKHIFVLSPVSTIHHKMAAFREAREALLLAFQDGSIDDTEFALLYDSNSSENLEFPDWRYGCFDLDSMTDDECKAEFK